MTLTFDTHSTSLTHLAKCFKQLRDPRLQEFPKKKKKINNFHFFPYNTGVTKFDLGVKWVKVNPGSLFEQLW